MIIGYHFGTSFKADSIIAAYTIPNFLYIAAGGALTTAFISLYTKAPDDTKQELKNVIFTYTFIIFGAVSISFLVIPSLWMRIFFRAITQNKSRDKVLFQITGISTVFLVSSMIFSGLLNLHDRFRASALAPFINNLAFVGLALALFPIFGIQAYAIGAFIGSLLMMIPLIREMKKNDLMTFRFQVKMKDSHYLTRYLKVMIPILLGGATLQFYFLIHRIFASELQEGLLAALNYASKLVQLPQTILMTAVTTVIYPLIAKTIAKKEYNKLSKMYNDGMAYLLYLMVPISVFVFLTPRRLIGFVFEYGSFRRSDPADERIIENLCHGDVRPCCQCLCDKVLLRSGTCIDSCHFRCHCGIWRKYFDCTGYHQNLWGRRNCLGYNHQCVLPIDFSYSMCT